MRQKEFWDTAKQEIHLGRCEKADIWCLSTGNEPRSRIQVRINVLLSYDIVRGAQLYGYMYFESESLFLGTWVWEDPGPNSTVPDFRTPDILAGFF